MILSDIEAEARSLVDADSTTYPAATLLRRENAAYEEIVAKILECDGKWQFDDSRYTDFPIGTATLVNNQQDYTFDSTVLDVEEVAVLDLAGKWQKIHPFDPKDLSFDASQLNQNAGFPYLYDKQGKSLILYPAPSSAYVTLTNGLKVNFRRTASVFTSAEQSAGTTSPGFASPFHILLAYKAALPYAQQYKKDRVAWLVGEIARLEKELVKFYSRREQDRRKVMRFRGVNPR